MGRARELQANWGEALKHYKKLFFCARLLDDQVGAALSLNHLGVI